MADIEKTNAAEKKAEVKENKKKVSKDRKPGFGSKIVNFFKGYRSEAKKVVWFSKQQTLKSTAVVIVVMVIVSAVVSLLDLGIHELIMWIGSLV